MDLDSTPKKGDEKIRHKVIASSEKPPSHLCVCVRDQRVAQKQIAIFHRAGETNEDKSPAGSAARTQLSRTTRPPSNPPPVQSAEECCGQRRWLTDSASAACALHSCAVADADTHRNTLENVLKWVSWRCVRATPSSRPQTPTFFAPNLLRLWLLISARRRERRLIMSALIYTPSGEAGGCLETENTKCAQDLRSSSSDFDFECVIKAECDAQTEVENSA